MRTRDGLRAALAAEGSTGPVDGSSGEPVFPEPGCFGGTAARDRRELL